MTTYYTIKSLLAHIKENHETIENPVKIQASSAIQLIDGKDKI